MKILFAIFLAFLMPILAQARTEQIPPWYSGSKPWAELPNKTKTEITRLHNGVEEAKRQATLPPTSTQERKLVMMGKESIDRIVIKYKLDKFYNKPSISGRKNMFWIPEVEWRKLPPEIRRSIVAYAKSLNKNWGIGVGRVKGKDVLADRDLEID